MRTSYTVLALLATAASSVYASNDLDAITEMMRRHDHLNAGRNPQHNKHYQRSQAKARRASQNIKAERCAAKSLSLSSVAAQSTASLASVSAASTASVNATPTTHKETPTTKVHKPKTSQKDDDDDDDDDDDSKKNQADDDDDSDDDDDDKNGGNESKSDGKSKGGKKQKSKDSDDDDDDNDDDDDDDSGSGGGGGGGTFTGEGTFYDIGMVSWIL